MLSDIRKERLKKLEKIREEGIDPYPARVKARISLDEASGRFNALGRSKKKLYLAGRIVSLRDQGRLFFFDIDDGTGKMQVFASRREMKRFDLWKETLDIGDFVGVKGMLFKTKSGEKSLRCTSLDMLAKSLRPLPDYWFGLKDVEGRFRRRYLDLLMNREVKKTFELRSSVLRKLREFLWKEGFIEVETPVLQPIPGGATARPFKTYHNALGEEFYLRIAPELYLKRLLVGGFNKIFEMSRVFRNEGIDKDHNPEFTMLELYWTYQNYTGLIKFTEKLLKPYIKSSWKKISYAEAFRKYAGRELNGIKDKGSIDDIFKRKVLPALKHPTIIYGHPKSISPLSKLQSGGGDTTERFQFIIDSVEIVNGFSELNDPIDQRERMEYQEKLFRKGNQEAARIDKDFLEALEYAMPPAAGLGIGIDRLIAIIIGRKSIKESILFPTLRTEKKD
ncbi:MAG: OB-fold nucleic acid binding domain-containing protein [Candidatus Colwellbacteria bacterium]|nr:OB-fold nucleic acid binding domain-containing protein [Candidatus Colwellbacteria bacterium]